MKSKITAFIDSLGSYDYALFGGTFVVFILLIFLTILLRRRIILALLLFLISFSSLFLVPTIGRKYMYDYLYANSVEIISQKRLHYSDAIVVKGKLKNISDRNFKICKINIKVHKVSTNKLRNLMFQFKHIQQLTIYEEDIVKDEEIKFKAIIEPFKYKKDYNLTIEASCK